MTDDINQIAPPEKVDAKLIGVPMGNPKKE